MLVDPLFAQWLQSEGDYVVRSDAASIARWGTTALTTERLTGIASEASAIAEGNRQLAFFSRGPFGVDVHDVLGTDWHSALCTVIELDIDELSYGGGREVFLLAVELDRATGISSLTVLCPLKDV